MLPDFSDWEDFVQLAYQTSPKALALMLTGLSVTVLYFGLLEAPGVPRWAKPSAGCASCGRTGIHPVFLAPCCGS